MENEALTIKTYPVYVNIEGSGIIPKQQHKGDAGFDLVAASPAKIFGLENLEHKGFYHYIDYIEYDTNVRVAPPKNIFSTVFPRSSISNKNLVLANSVGLIDSGYRDTIKLRFKYVAQPWDYQSFENGDLLTTIDAARIYKKGDRIGQLVFFEHTNVNLNKISAEDLANDPSSRGEGGFGSTGD